MESLVGHFLMFTAIAVVFLLVPLLIGRFLRPKLPTPEKDAIYECGEPTIGTSYIQFDLRFYVVALLFIIFDVEVAFFFPWATIFGGANQLADERLGQSDNPVVRRAGEEARRNVSEKLLNQPPGALKGQPENVIDAGTAQTIAWTALCDILVFFGVLLVGFAYVWKRGDLDWVRAMTERSRESALHPRPPPAPAPETDLEREPEPVGV